MKVVKVAKMIILLLLIKLIECYYMEGKYRDSAVNVTYQIDKNKRVYMSFVLEGIEYNSVIDPDQTQMYGKNAYKAYNTIYMCKHKPSGINGVPTLHISLNSAKGWFIQEKDVEEISGVIMDEDKVIHIKPKRILYPNCSEDGMLAFVADPDFPEYVCATKIEEIEEKEDDEIDNLIEEDYIDGVRRYFEEEQDSSTKSNRKEENKYISFIQWIKTITPSFAERILFWWRPISTHGPIALKESFSELETESSDQKEEDEQMKLEIAKKELKRIRVEEWAKQKRNCKKCNIYSKEVDVINEEDIIGISVEDKPVVNNPSSQSITDSQSTTEETIILISSDKKDTANNKADNKANKSKQLKKKNRKNAKLAKSNKSTSRQKQPNNPKTTKQSTKDKIKKGELVYLGVPFYNLIKKVEKINGKKPSYGFPTEKRAIPIAVALDKCFIDRHGSLRLAILFVLETVNIVSKIYEKAFNIFLYISDIITDQKAEWYYSKTDLLTKLNLFTEYRKEKNKKCMIYHVFTGGEITERKLGLAWTGYVGYKAKKNVGISVLVPNQFMTVAHEIAHNFGLIHDCDEGLCKEATDVSYPCHPCKGCDCKKKYIMSRSGAKNLFSFSLSSQREMYAILSQLESILPRVEDVNMPYSVCGNGMMGQGKECDAGPFGDKCCTPDCKLRPGAVCSDSNSKCCNNCQISPKGVVCRTAENECQKDSFCDGVSSRCPIPSFLPNTQKCSVGFCAEGMCTNRDIQCTLAGDRYKIVSSYGRYKGCTMHCLNIKSEIVILKNRYFRDGTPCGLNGVCMDGKCKKDMTRPLISFAAMLTGLVLLALYISNS